MERLVSATEARVRFGEMLRRANSGETLIVVRSGSPQAVILSIAEYKQLRAAEAEQTSWSEKVRAVRSRVAAEVGDRALPAAETIIRQMREERDGQQLDMH